MPVDDDERLFDAWCSGDQAAGEALFERHYRSVARYFANKASRDADDLTQRTFLACVRSRERFRHASSVRVFIFGVARNVWLRWLRDRARHEGRTCSLENSVTDIAAGPSTLARAQREQAIVLDALRRVPMHYQEVLELHYWEDLPAGTIAEIVGITEHNVRNRLRRGRLALQRLLERGASAIAARRRIAAHMEHWARNADPLAT